MCIPPRSPATADPAFCSPGDGAPAAARSPPRAPRALRRDGGGEGAVVPDPGAQAGGHHVDVEDVRVRGVDPADDGCHEPVEHAPAHPGADQGRDARGLGPGAQRGGQQLVERGPERTEEAEGAADFRVPGVGRDAKDPGAGQFARAVGQLDPGAAGLRGDDLPGQAQFGGEIRDGGGARGEGLGAAVQGQAGHDVAADAAAPRAGGLQDRGADAGTGQFARGQQAGDPAAHHHSGGCCGVPAGWRGRGLPPRAYSGEIEWISVDDAREHVGIGFRRHTVAEVQHVAGGCGAGGNDVADVGFQHLPRRGQQGRVDVALQRHRAAQPAVGFVQRQPVVHADDVDADVAHGDEQLRGAGAEVDQRGAEATHVVQGPGGGRRDEALVVGQAEGPGPGVEELAGGSAGFQLGAEEHAGGVGGPVGQRGPGLRVGVHHGARAEVVAGRLPLHHVRGERERRAGKADQRGLPQLGDGEPDGLADGLEGFPGQLGQGGDVGRGADRLVQHGTDAGDDVHADSGQLERNDDVGEEDGGVDVVAADRLQGDLGGQLRAQAGVQHRDPLAQLEVFGQRAAGLAHEPHRTAGGLAAAVGGDQRGIRGAAVHQRVPGVEAGEFRSCRSARSHDFDCAENQPQKITTACHRHGRRAGPRPGRGGNHSRGVGSPTPGSCSTRGTKKL